MSDQTLKYKTIDCINAIQFLEWHMRKGPINDVVSIAECVLNGDWEYAPKQMSYQGYSSQERMCETVSGDREWKMDASGQSI